MKRQRESIRLFQNEWLEKLSHVHPITPLVIWGPVIFALLWRSFNVHYLSLASVIFLGILGFLIWTLAEYMLHRFVFHYKPTSVFGRRVHFIIHGIHHDDPEDATRLVMPPVAAVVLGATLYVFFRVLLGAVYVEPFFALFLVGYLCYDYIHFYVHHFVPKTRFGKFLKQNHMLHHFVTPEARWGVSSPLWDHVFGTVLEHNKHQPSPR